jgi:1,4-dihydroxy-2-naphthoate octaprenyltransferase
MKKYLTLVEGLVIGIAGLVMVILGWADDNLKWLLLILSPSIIVASVAIFFFQHNRDKQSDTAE